MSAEIDASTRAAYAISEDALVTAVKKVIHGIPHLVRRPLSIKSESSTEFLEPKPQQPGVYDKDVHVHIVVRRDPNGDVGAIKVKFVSRRGTIERRSGAFAPDFTMKVSCSGDCAAAEIAERTRRFMDLVMNNEAYPVKPNE